MTIKLVDITDIHEFTSINSNMREKGVKSLLISDNSVIFQGFEEKKVEIPIKNLAKSCVYGKNTFYKFS